MDEINTQDDSQIVRTSVAGLFEDLPIPVQRFLKGQERDTIVSELTQKHALHIDQGGEFETAFLYLLLGAFTPQEFTDALKAAGLTAEQISGLTSDVNERVFQKLRNEEREGGTPSAQTSTATPQPESVAPATPIVPTAAPPTLRASVPIYSPLPAPSAPSTPPTPVAQAVERPRVKNVLPPPNLPGQMPERPTPPPPPRIEVPVAPMPPPQPLPVRVPQVPTEAPRADSNPRVIHTMARDMQALKGGVDPFRVAHPEPPAWTREPAKPVAAPAPQTVAPAPQPTPPHEIPAPHPQEAMRTHLKQYGVDPYRESVE